MDYLFIPERAQKIDAKYFPMHLHLKPFLSSQNRSFFKKNFFFFSTGLQTQNFKQKLVERAKKE